MECSESDRSRRDSFRDLRLCFFSFLEGSSFEDFISNDDLDTLENFDSLLGFDSLLDFASFRRDSFVDFLTPLGGL